MAQGGTFQWTTNIQEVATQTEQALRRINRATQNLTGMDAKTGAGFAQGIQARARGVEQQMRSNLQAIGQEFDREMTQAAKRGERFSGRVGGKTLQGSQQAELDRAMRDLDRLGRQAGQGLPPQLAHMRTTIQESLRDVGRSMAQVYTEDVGAVRRQLDAVRQQTGVRMESGSHLGRRDAGERAGSRAWQRAGQLEVPSSASDIIQAQHALGSVVSQSGITSAEVGRLQTHLKTSRDALATAKEEAARVASEIRANTRRDGTPLDPEGARVLDKGRGRYRDAQGRNWNEVFDGKQSLGVVAEALNESELQAAATDIKDTAQDARNETKLSKEEQRAQTEKQRTTQRSLRSSVDRRLASELELGRAMQVSKNVVQDAAGRFYRFNKVAGGMEPRLVTPRTEGPTSYARLEAQAEAKRLADQERIRRQQQQRAQPPMVAPGGAGGRGGGGGMLDSFFEQASGGGQGRGLRGMDIMQNMMSYARYFVSATALMGTISALSAAKDAVVEYREALTDLEVALGEGQSASAGFISGLSDVARFAGANTGDAIDSAVRGIRAFAPLGEDGAVETDVAENMGTEVAKTAQQLAVIAEKELKDATGDVISIAFAFDLDMDDQVGNAFGRITDAVSVAKRQLTGDAAEIAQGLSSIGTAAGEAGFTLEETANLVSLVQARTDQTGRAVATRLGRIFSIIGGSGGRTAITQLNTQLDESMKIDTTGSVRDQLMGISRIYGDLSKQQQNLIRSGLGGTANIRELIPILQSPDLLDDALEAQFEGAGRGADEFERKSDDLAGTLRKLKGDVTGIVNALFEANVADIFGAAIRTLEPMLNLVRTAINAYNRLADIFNTVSIAGIGLGDTLQSLLAITIQFKAVAKVWESASKWGLTAGLVGRFNGMKGMVAGGAAGAAGAAAASARPAGSGVDAQMFDALDFSNTSKLKGTLASIGASLNNLWMGAKNFVASNPLLLAVGGLMAIQKAWDDTNAVLKQTAAAEDLMSTQVAREDPKDMRELAQSMRNSAADTRDRGIIGTVVDELFNNNDAERAADRLDTRARRMWENAKQLEDARTESARGQSPWETVDLSTAEGVDESMTLLEDQGRDATTRVEALSTAIGHMADQANRSVTALNDLEKIEFGMDLGDRFRTELGSWETAERDQADFGKNYFWSRSKNPDAMSYDDLDPIADFLANDDIQTEIDDLIQQGVDAQGGELDDEAQQELIEFVMRAIRGKMEGFEDLSEEGVEMLEGAATMAVSQIIKEYENLDDPAVAIAAAQRMVKESEAAANELDTERRLTGGSGASVAAARERTERLRSALAELESMENVDSSAFEQMRRSIQEAELAEVEAMSGRIDRLAALETSELASTDAVGRAQAELDRINDQISNTNDQEKLDELNASKNDAQQSLAQAELDRSDAERMAWVDSRDTVETSRAEASNIMRRLTHMVEQGDGSSAEYWQLRKQYADALVEIARQEADAAAAAREAARDPRDTIQAAVDAVLDARDSLDAEKEGTAGYDRALAQYRQAVIDEAAEKREYASAVREAARDPRDTVGAAVDAVTDAREALDGEKEGTLGYSQALAEYREAVIDEAAEKRAYAAAVRDARVDPESSVQGAAASLETARAELNAAIPNTIEFEEARAEYQQEQVNYANALIEAASLSRQVGIDLTDPVATAQEELRTAREKLEQARRRGAPQDVIDQRKVDVENAENQAEAAAFSQRLNDVQHANDMGRMSHSAYMNYLQSEHDRLTAISDKTRQQVEQIQQIDQALKAAQDEMEGQFNLGDIRMPTPYEVRRSIAAQAQGISPSTAAHGQAQQVGQSTTVENTIMVNGADTAEVTRILKQILGPQAMGRNSAGTSGTRRL